jgi:hypothetical protein
MEIEGESERIASDACSAVDFGRSGESGQSSQAFGDLGTAGEAITAQDEAWRRGGFGYRQPWQGGVEQDDVREAGEDHRLGRRTVSRVQRYALDGEAKREGKDRFITADRAPAVTGGGDRRRTQAWGEATLQAARAQSTGGSAVVVGWESHRWLGEEQGEWSLMAVMDDATGALLHGRFAPEEDVQSYLICLRQVVLDKGIPLALYMDRHGIFRRNDDHWSLQEQLAGEQTPTQVGQALRALGIEAIFALSPQAKGRVERLFNMLQDRLVQELRLARINTAHDATAFLNGPFKADFNARFSNRPEKAKPPGGLCPKDSMSIGSAVFAMRLP